MGWRGTYSNKDKARHHTCIKYDFIRPIILYQGVSCCKDDSQQGNDIKFDTPGADAGLYQAQLYNIKHINYYKILNTINKLTI